MVIGGFSETMGMRRQNRGMRDAKVFQEGTNISVDDSDGLNRYETRKKVHNLNTRYETRKNVTFYKRYKTRREGIKFKSNNTKISNETLFWSFAKQLETLFSYFRIFSVSRNDRNLAK